MNDHRTRANLPKLIAAFATLTLLAAACSDLEAPTIGLDDSAGLLLAGDSFGADIEGTARNAVETPSERGAVSWGGRTLRFWPYTGSDLSGQPSDPINLIFAGPVNPVALRAALLALDGDRSSFNYPNVPPFNARWTDAIGDVQATYVEGAGWSGSEVQLALGDYDGARFHVRFFRAGLPPEAGDAWTLGAAHFEVLIPNTADHQVLSWERAEEIVVADLVRSGLLAPGTGPVPTGPLHPTDGFRSIPSFLYNGLPPDLIQFIQGPPNPVSEDVPIGTDGYATLLVLRDGPRSETGVRSQHLTLEYDQVIPKPFCSDGPTDWVYVRGPVDLTKTIRVGERGDYRYESRITGRLTIVPVDITQSPPAPVGDPYTAEIGDRQLGLSGERSGSVEARVRRIGRVAGGSEIQQTHMRVATNGAPVCVQVTSCPGS